MSEFINIGQILLVDDEKIYADPFQRYAKEHHLNTHWESTGRSALNYLLSNHNNVVLVVLDMDLPDMHGIKVQKEITKLYPHIHIFISTARMLSPTNHVVGIELNAKQYIDKALGLEYIFSLINQDLESINQDLESINQDPKRLNDQGKVLIYDEDAKRFYFNGKGLDLTKAQKTILLTLYKNPNTCLSKETLKSKAELASSAEVRGYISKIRTSLKISGLNNPKDLIITDSSEGYRYTP